MSQSLAIFPLKGYSFTTIPITQRYSISHRGIDLAAPEGTEVDAPLAGTIIFAGADTSGYGNLVTEKSGQFSYLFAHLKSFLTFVGEKVQQGQALGYEGQTGNATGPHLHFELRENDVPIDPTMFLAQARPNPPNAQNPAPPTPPGITLPGGITIPLPTPTSPGNTVSGNWLQDLLTPIGRQLLTWFQGVALKGGLTVVAVILIVVGILRITE